MRAGSSLACVRLQTHGDSASAIPPGGDCVPKLSRTDNPHSYNTLVYYRLTMNMEPMSLCELFLNNPVWAEWALVLVGILTMIVIGWQAVATAKAAKAAQASTEALVTIYRPWLLFEATDPLRLRNDLLPRQGQEGIERIVLQFKNYGQTPAWVRESSCKLINIEGPNIPEPLEYGSSIELPNPNDVPPDHPYHIVVEPAPFLRITDLNEIAEGKRTLCIFGYFKYQIFPGKHATTNFCLRYSIRMREPFIEWEGWEYAGPAGANKHT
jgi:hypothetical protein